VEVVVDVEAVDDVDVAVVEVVVVVELVVVVVYLNRGVVPRIAVACGPSARDLAWG
jgi:hypothetical protein